MPLKQENVGQARVVAAAKRARTSGRKQLYSKTGRPPFGEQEAKRKADRPCRVLGISMECRAVFGEYVEENVRLEECVVYPSRLDSGDGYAVRSMIMGVFLMLLCQSFGPFALETPRWRYICLVPRNGWTRSDCYRRNCVAEGSKARNLAVSVVCQHHA